MTGKLCFHIHLVPQRGMTVYPGRRFPLRWVGEVVVSTIGGVKVGVGVRYGDKDGEGVSFDEQPPKKDTSNKPITIGPKKPNVCIFMKFPPFLSFILVIFDMKEKVTHYFLTENSNNTNQIIIVIFLVVIHII